MSHEGSDPQPGSDPGGGAAAATAEPLAEAKISAPVLRAGLIDRSRVRGALDANGAAALTLVAAPAGYGKTTAVRAWSAGGDAGLAWVRLDAHDNDPVRLWTSIATAVDRIRPGLGRPAMRTLKVFGRSIEASVDELANSLAAFSDEVAVVLDDLHVVTHADSIASLNHAVAVLPANVRLIVISRTDPALRLPQLRAGGELVELRASELMFTVAEAHELLVEREGIDLSDAEVELLHARTEGWPAALFLAALWLRRAGNPHETVRAFGGDHHFIADYLTTEVIASLDEATRGFLLQACVLRQFTPELCDAVLGRADSEAVLARLASANPFVSRLERGGAYRVHSLFAEFAAYQLRALDPDAAGDIHRRASSWFRSRRMCAEAVEHAAAAGDLELVADILADHYLQLIRTGQSHALRQWMQLLDDEQIVSHPVLAVGGATAAMVLGGEGFERRHYLDLVRRTEVEYPERMTPYVRSTAAMVSAAAVDRDVGRAVEAGREAVAFARMDAESDASLVAALAACSRALYLAGDVDDAWATALEAVEHPDIVRRRPGYALACTALALAAVDRGWLPSARAHAERAKSIIDDLGLNRTWLGANTAAALGCVSAGEGDLAEAESKLAIAEHFFGGVIISVPQAWVLVRLAEVRCRRGRLEQAQATLQPAIDALETFTDGGRVPLLAAEVERAIGQERGRASRGELLEKPSLAEISVLRLLAGNLSAREIGGELFISPNTVRSHTRALYRKLGVNSRADAIARAELLGLLAPTTSPI